MRSKINKIKKKWILSITRLRVLNNNSMKKYNRFSRIQAPSSLNNSSQNDNVFIYTETWIFRTGGLSKEYSYNNIKQ